MSAAAVSIPTTADFERAGASPTEAAELLRQHNVAAGRHSPASDTQPQPSTPPAQQRAPQIPAPSAEAIEERMRRYDEAKLRRPAQSIVEQELRVEAQLDALKNNGQRSLQAQWDQANEDAVTADDPRFAKMLDKEMTPAANVYDYQLPRPEGEEASKADNELRAAFVDAQLPIWAGNSIAETIDRNFRELSRATPEQIAARRDDAQATLERVWGPEYQARTARLHEFLRSTASRHPVIDQLLRNAPEVLDSSWQVMETLSRIAEYRHRTGGK